MIRRLIIASIAVLTVFIFKCDAQEVTKQRVKPIRENTAEQMKSPYMIFISADGFRYDYAEKYKAKNLLKQANEGVKATSMIPVFPSSTGPNHYSLVTGLYPVHNGIIGNSFYDPVRKKLKDGTNTWLKNDPIWISAEKQGMVTASLGFIGSKQKINGMQNSYYYEYGKPRIGMTERVEIIKNGFRSQKKYAHILSPFTITKLTMPAMALDPILRKPRKLLEKLTLLSHSYKLLLKKVVYL
jgi:hypothetical protein